MRASHAALSLLIWWLAVISPSGETQILEYRTKESCSLIERLYQAVGMKTTGCQWKESS